MSGENTRNAAGREQSPAAFTDNHHRELYLQAMKSAVLDIYSAVEQLMGNAYFQLFWNPPKTLQQFLLPLLRMPSPRRNGKRDDSILKRDDFLEKCCQETQRAAREARGSSQGSMNWLDNESFDNLVRLELKQLEELSKTDRAAAKERIRAFFRSMDLPACCKVNVPHIAQDERVKVMDLYSALRQRGLLAGIDKRGWGELCKQAMNDRNTYIHGGAEGALNVWSQGGPERALTNWYRLAELLHHKDLNQEDYERVQSLRNRADGIQNSQVFFFRDLLQDVKIPGMDEAGLYRCACSRHIPCDEACALYHGTRDELIRALEQEHRANSKVSIEELWEAVGDDIQDLEALLSGLGYPIDGGMVLGHARDEVLSVLRLELDRRDLAAKNQALGDQAQALEEEKQQLLQRAQASLKVRRLTPEQQEEIAKSPDLLQKIAQMADENLRRLPRLWELEDLREGPLSALQLDELAETHRLVLDGTLLRSPVGRDFIRRDLLPRAKAKGIPLEVEATARYHLLYRDLNAYQQAKDVYNRTDWTVRSEEERQEAEDRLQKLRAASSAYILLRDELQELREAGLLRWIGVPDPCRRDEDMLLWLLDNRYSAQRVCVLTCGATPLTQCITRDSFPLCAVARVYFSPQTQERPTGPACLIFPQYLPLEAGGGGGAAPSALQAPTQASGPAFPPATELRQADDSPLPRSLEPKAEDLLYTRPDFTQEDVPVQLVGRCLAKGGEGALYRVKLENMVAKLYHPDRLTVGRKQKLEDMVAHNPHIKNVCWPTHLLYNTAREFVGFLMPRAPQEAYTFQESVLQLDKPSVRRHVLPGWGRVDLARTAKAAADLAAALHRNNILIGDINDSNFMVEPEDSSAVYLVDCDSFQLDGYPCPVGVEDYTHPDVADRQDAAGGPVLRREEEEDYSLAILIFRILTLCREPFDTSGGIDPFQAMRERRFLSEDKCTRGGERIRKNIPKAMETAFTHTFQDGNPSSARDWSRMLSDYIRDIEKGLYSPDLIPLTFPNYTHKPEKDFYKYVTCESCGNTFNIPTDAYERRQRLGALILCPQCADFMDRLKGSKALIGDHPLALTCRLCGRRFPDPQNPKDSQVCDDLVFFFKARGQVTCPQCSTRVSARCELCGRKYSEKAYWFAKYRKMEYPRVCWSCREKPPEKGFQLTCHVCGKAFSVSGKWNEALLQHYKEGKGFCCDEHMDKQPSAN